MCGSGRPPSDVRVTQHVEADSAGGETEPASWRRRTRGPPCRTPGAGDTALFEFRSAPAVRPRGPPVEPWDQVIATVSYQNVSCVVVQNTALNDIPVMVVAAAGIGTDADVA